MKRVFAILVLLTLAVGSLSARTVNSGSYRVQDIPNVQRLDASRFVSNPDKLLSDRAVYIIDTMLLQLKKSGRAQVAVVAVNSIGNASPFDFLHELLTDWGVGRKDTDDGLGLLLVIDQGTIEIQTGYGLEGDLPDALIKRIINERMLPAFRNQDWDSGMISGVAAITDILNGRTPADLSSDEDDIAAWISLIICILLIGGVLVASYFSGRCPKCHKKTLHRTDSSRIIDSRSNSIIRIETYTCSNCGYVTSKRRSDSNSDDMIGGGLGGLFGGLGGFGGGFGSGSGGSFGGGSFGGGGARGRF